MSKSRKPGRGTQPPAARAAVILLAAALVAGFVWLRNTRSPAASPAAAAPPPTATVAEHPPATPATPAAPASPELRRLEGRWERTDGVYVLAIRSVEPGGKLDAGYFNPRPIHVARAEATRAGELVKVFVELRDRNYPGSTYDLRYDAARDVLAGTYFQALEGQTFEVSFARR